MIGLERRPTKGKAAGAKPLIARRVPGTKLDDEAIVSELGTIAGIFHRSSLRITVHGAAKKKTEEVVKLAVDRYALGAERITLGKAPARPNVLATIEILEPR
jgi:hypothetical protein